MDNEPLLVNIDEPAIYLDCLLISLHSECFITIRVGGTLSVRFTLAVNLAIC